MMTTTLTKILEKNPSILKNTFRKGRLVNNGTVGLSCKDEQAIPWKYGREVMRVMKSVSMCFGCKKSE